MALESATLIPEKDQIQRAVPRITEGYNGGVEPDLNEVILARENERAIGFNAGITAALMISRRYNGPDSIPVRKIRSLYNETL